LTRVRLHAAGAFGGFFKESESFLAKQKRSTELRRIRVKRDRWARDARFAQPGVGEFDVALLRTELKSNGWKGAPAGVS
jgi:hypothetical protein